MSLGCTPRLCRLLQNLQDTSTPTPSALPVQVLWVSLRQTAPPYQEAASSPKPQNRELQTGLRPEACCVIYTGVRQVEEAHHIWRGRENWTREWDLGPLKCGNRRGLPCRLSVYRSLLDNVSSLPVHDSAHSWSGVGCPSILHSSPSVTHVQECK